MSLADPAVVRWQVTGTSPQEDMQIDDTLVSFDAVLAAARPRLLRLAHLHGIAPHVAEDVVQDTLIAAWRQQATLRDATRVDAWLDTICRNRCRMHIRHMAATHIVALDDDGADLAIEADLADELERQDLAMLLDQALGYLPPPTRQVVELCYLHEMPQREVAARLGMTLAALEVRLHRARRQLRHIINGELRATAAALDLPLDGGDVAAWRETREWCHLCGKQRMRATFAPMPDGRVNFRLRCPVCSPQYDIDIHNSFGIVPLAGLRSVKPALKRTILHVNRAYASTLASASRPCLVCGRLGMSARVAMLPQHAPPHSSSWHFACQHCGFAHAIWAGGVVFLANPSIVPLAEQFIKTHPRWIMLPDRHVEYMGTPAILYSIGDAASAASVTVAAAQQSLRVLAAFTE